MTLLQLHGNFKGFSYKYKKIQGEQPFSKSLPKTHQRLFFLEYLKRHFQSRYQKDIEDSFFAILAIRTCRRERDI